MDTNTESAILENPKRLNALNELGLLDSPTEAVFDRLTRLASLITGSPFSLVSLIDADRAFFKSAFGLPEPIATEREAPLSHSICKHVVIDASPLIVEDAREHPTLKDNGAVVDYAIKAYLGMPLTTSTGAALGSFCVLDPQMRQWTPEQIEVMRELATSVMTEIELRAQITARQKAEEALLKKNKQYQRTYWIADQTLNHLHEIIGRGATPSEIKGYLATMQEELNKLQN